MFLVLTLLLIGALLIFYKLSQIYSYWEIRGAPFDKPFLLFGSFYEVATGKWHVSRAIRSIYHNFDTPYVGFYIFHQPNLMVRSPDLIKQILVKDFDKFQDRNSMADEKADPIAYHSLLTARGATWKTNRAKVTPAFTSGKMKMMLPLMEQRAQDLVQYLTKNNGQIVEVRIMTKKYTVDNISSCGFGFNARCFTEDNSKIEEMATRLISFDDWQRMLAGVSFVFIPNLFAAFKLRLLDKIAADYLFATFKENLRRRQQMKIERHDVIDLLNSEKKSDNELDDLKMLSQAVVIFNAGNDTTSTAMSFLLYELALNQDIQERLRQEVNDTFQSDQLSYEGIQSMKYMDMVMAETLRKYPVNPFLIRQSNVDYIIHDTGFKIDKDTDIIIPTVGLHSDPKYFPQPEKFDPERFNEQNRANIVPYTYLPFGGGPRSCIGMRFALLAARVAVVSMLKQFRFEIDSTTPATLELKQSAMGLDPKVVPLRVHRIV